MCTTMQLCQARVLRQPEWKKLFLQSAVWLISASASRIQVCPSMFSVWLCMPDFWPMLMARHSMQDAEHVSLSLLCSCTFRDSLATIQKLCTAEHPSTCVLRLQPFQPCLHTASLMSHTY